MSGGSFEYLFEKDEPPNYLLEAMAVELASRGFADAAEATRALAHPAPSEAIREVWRAVEWVCSNDSGPETIEQAISNWRTVTG